jgi:O-glycosyl hydrolase
VAAVVTLAVSVAWGLGLPTQAQDAAVDVIIDGADVGRQFHGAGAISAGANARLLIDYPEPQRSQILDYLYKPGYGAELQILKVEMGGGSNTTAGSDPSHMLQPDQVDCNRGYQWWLMKEAKKRSPDIILYAQQWSAPGWLDGVWSQDNIEYHLSYLKCAEKHGLQIDYIGGWNEKGFDVDWFIKLDKALEKHYPDVKIPAADEIYQQPDDWPVADSMAADPRFEEAVDQIAMHWPCQWRTKYRHCPSNETARELGTPMQMTNAGMGHDVGGAPNARALNRMYVDGKFTSYLIWNTVETWYANLPIGNSGIMQARWPWSGYYELGKNIWAFAHTTQFTEPGWHYLDTGSGRLPSNASYVTLVSPSGEDYSTVIEAMDVGMPTTVTFQLQHLPDRELKLWTTDMASDARAAHFQESRTIDPDSGAFKLTIRPDHLYSITTTRGQGKGLVFPEASPHEQLALPFSETFEDVEEGKMATLFTTLSAEFETAPCEVGRSGTCYEQLLNQGPIVWNNLGKLPPTTMIGDPRWTGNYTLRTKALLKESGYVELIGRVSGQRPWSSWLGGYHLRIGTDGWALYTEDPASTTRDTISSGTAHIETETWHDLALEMKGAQIEVVVDGKTVKRLEDTRQRAGNAALRVSKWNHAQFDDVQITLTGSGPSFLPVDQVTVADVSSAQGFYKGWTYEAANAINDRPETRWQTEDQPTPHSITLDLGTEREIHGLWVRPRFDKTNAMITDYRIEVSRDGKTFRPVQDGAWPATASTKVATWDDAVRARYVRLVATGHVNDQASVADIKVVTEGF